MSVYLTPVVNVGIDKCICLSDGYSIAITWFEAYPLSSQNQIAYNLYYSTSKESVFTEGPKYVSTGPDLTANIIDLIPGQNYYFSVRPIECNADTYSQLQALPIAYDSLRLYPTSFLSTDISDSQLTIPLVDTDLFPAAGLILIGSEVVNYEHKNSTNLLLNNIADRGYLNTYARSHTTDGYDGYHHLSAEIRLFIPGEDLRYDRIYICQNRFEYPNFALTKDGFHQVTRDLLSTDLETSDAQNVGFPSYDYAGWHRTDPVLLLTGDCVGSYIGGEQYCLDGYGVGRVVRGFNAQDAIDQREEVQLSTTGKPAVLIQKMKTGITCSCYLASSEYADDRCPYCYGQKLVYSYQQYFNPRRADGRILVRVGPVDESLKVYEGGLESELPADMWTLTVPTIYMRDIIVLFDLAGNEEFRYEVLGVTRNNTFVGMEGGQKFRVARIRKTDPAYQIRIFRDTSMFPSKFQTTATVAPGLSLHTHEIVRNEKDPSGFSQTTGVSQGHNHPVAYISGQLIVLPALNHTHSIII